MNNKARSNRQGSEAITVVMQARQNQQQGQCKGRGKQVHVGPMRQEPTRAGRTRQQGHEGTLGRPLWREETLAAQLLRQRRREVTLAGQR